MQPYDSTVTSISWSVSIAVSPTCSHNSATRTITISNIVPTTKIVAGTAVQITLANMKNPSTSTSSSSFTVSTYEVNSGNNYILDTVTTGLTLKSNCNYPCKECSSSTPSVCTSWLKDSSGNQLLLQTSTVSGSSVTTWVSSWNEDYANVNNICQPCLANWGAWLSTDLSSWTKWGKSAAQFLIGTRWTNSCPDATYGNTSNNKWDSCVYPWSTWTSATSWKTWAKLDSSGNTSSLIKLQGDQWLSAWTANTYVDLNSICTAWSSNWKYCSTKTTIWTAWNSPLILDNIDSTWKTTCPSGTTVYNSATNTWDVCDTNWATWSGTISTWTSCVSGLVLTTAYKWATGCLTTAEYVNTNSQWVNWATGWKTWSGASNYWDKWNTGYLFANFTWVTSCPSGFSKDLSDSTRWVLSNLQCAFGYQIDQSGTKCIPSSIVWNSGYALNVDKTKWIPEPGAVAPFPFLIIYFVFVIVIVIGYIKNRNEMLTTWLIKGIAILEIPYFIVQIWSAAYISSWGVWIGTIIALGILVFTNIAFYIVYNINVIDDNTFKHWKDKYKWQSYIISIISLLLNFKLFRCLYSNFYGLMVFHAPFEKSTKFYRPFVVMNIIYILLCLTPIIIVDIVTFYFIQWGYQLLVVAIESFIFSVTLIILSLIEFFKIKKRIFSNEDDSYLAINPKMFENAYTVAGGGAPNDNYQKPKFMNEREGPQFEDSQHSYFVNNYLNRDMKYNDPNNLSSIGFLSRFNSGKGLLDSDKKEWRTQLNKYVNKMNNVNSLYAASAAINIMDLKDNQIFKNRKDYDPNVKLDEEESYDKFDRKFLRRSKSYEDFREIDETFAPNKLELLEEKCISYPPSPRDMEKLDHYLFSDQIELIRDKMKAEFSYNNLYADKSKDEFDPESEFGKLRARRVQTYGKDFHELNLKGEDMKEEAEIDPDLAQSILDGVLWNISDDDDGDNQLVRRTKRERMALAKKRKMEIPDFAIEDIMGEFDIDDQGNYIILRNDQNNNLEDKRERRVNKKGYLIDKLGNIIDKYGNMIFKERELDSDDEIPPPYSFEKRKMQLLNRKPDEIEDYNLVDIPPEDDDHLWIDPKRREFAETMSGEETPVESMMGDTPGRYLSDKMSRKSKWNKDTNKTVHEDNINIDLDSQKETVKLDSTFLPGSVKSSKKTKRLTSARIADHKFDRKANKVSGINVKQDGFVKDVPFYFSQFPANQESKRNTPLRGKQKKRGPYDSSLRKIYGNVDPFLYKEDSSVTGVRLDKVINLKEKKYTNPFHLAESAEIEGRVKMENTDEELDSEMNRYSRYDKIAPKYPERSIFRDTSMKNRLNDLEDIYSTKLKQKEEEMNGRKTQHNLRLRNVE